MTLCLEVQHWTADGLLLVAKVNLPMQTAAFAKMTPLPAIVYVSPSKRQISLNVQ